MDCDTGFLAFTAKFTYCEGENMDTYAIALWALLGFALSTWFMMHIWLPDPPPDIFGKYILILVAGAVGGVVGGYLAHSSPALNGTISTIIGAIAGGLFLSGAVGFLSGAGRKVAH
jgi:hypothetical protein